MLFKHVQITLQNLKEHGKASKSYLIKDIDLISVCGWDVNVCSRTNRCQQKMGRISRSIHLWRTGSPSHNCAGPCTYSGIYKQQPVILCRATDNFLLICQNKETYDAMIIDFRKKWTVHALDEVKLFFGICFIWSDRCVTLNQTQKIKDIVIEVFGPSLDKQQGNKGYSTPMIAGTEHSNNLAACTPYLMNLLSRKTDFRLWILSYPGGMYALHFVDKLGYLNSMSRSCSVSSQSR
jgi:hypothetical protein